MASSSATGRTYLAPSGTHAVALRARRGTMAFRPASALGEPGPVPCAGPFSEAGPYRRPRPLPVVPQASLHHPVGLQLPPPQVELLKRQPSCRYDSAPVNPLCANRHTRSAHNRHFSRSIGLDMLHLAGSAFVLSQRSPRATNSVKTGQGGRSRLRDTRRGRAGQGANRRAAES